ncbi:LapD/MoxY N-terminal periplasmic domain-containing protein [Campylobacterota bacterium]
MSLFKQISIIMSLFLFVVILSVMTLNLQSAQKYAQQELYANAQNSAASLSLSLSNAKGDVSTMSTMINAVFDSGYYKEISLLDNNDKTLFKRTKEESELDIPAWFTNLYSFQSPVASANVSSGWNPIGQLQVTSLEDNAHIKLYENFLELLQTFAFIALITFTLLFFLLKLILSSLTRLEEQAEAVSDNNFIINENIPSTSEFREVTLAMNKMVTKVKDIFEKEAASVQNYHKALYTDSLTSLGNRNFFELKINDFLSSQEADTRGVILTLFFDGVSDANKSVGHEKVDKFIQELANVIKKRLENETNVLISRIDGTKFTMIFPGMQKDDIDDYADELLTQSIVSLENASFSECDCAIKLILTNYSSQDTTASLFNKIENSLQSTQKNSITYFSEGDINKETLEREIIENRIKEHSIALALQDVFDKDQNILHSEAYVRLFDEEKNIHEAGDFIPLVHKMNLDTHLDKTVINYAIKEPIMQEKIVAINISLRFIHNKDALQWLKGRLASLDKERVFNFEISNHNLLNSVNEGIEFSSILKGTGHHFGIDRFSIEEGSNLNYLQMIKPEYIKIDSHYLYDMLQKEQGESNPALQNLIESLDIKIIASNLEDEKIKTSLEEMGIKYFQGSLLSSPKLV